MKAISFLSLFLHKQVKKRTGKTTENLSNKIEIVSAENNNIKNPPSLLIEGNDFQ